MIPGKRAVRARAGWLPHLPCTGRSAVPRPCPASPGVLVGVLGQPDQVAQQHVRAVPGAREKLVGADLLQDGRQVLGGASPDRGVSVAERKHSAVKGSAKEREGGPRLAHMDLQLCIHVSCRDGPQIQSRVGRGESLRKGQTLPDNGTRLTTTTGGQARASEAIGVPWRGQCPPLSAPSGVTACPCVNQGRGAFSSAKGHLGVCNITVGRTTLSA